MNRSSFLGRTMLPVTVSRPHTEISCCSEARLRVEKVQKRDRNKDRMSILYKGQGFYTIFFNIIKLCKIQLE